MQPAPHNSFDAEVAFLDEQLAGSLDVGNRQAQVVGSPFDGLQWHVYVASSARDVPARPTFNVEVCMTELGDAAAQQFFRTDSFVSAAQTTCDTGIVHLKPGALVDDYVFEPCGYSMNGIAKTGLITIHVTPEKSCSYASVEVCRCASVFVYVCQCMSVSFHVWSACVCWASLSGMWMLQQV